MNTRQQAFLESLALKIPKRLEAIAKGSASANFILGTRQINGKQVRLILSAQVVNDGIELEDSQTTPDTQAQKRV